MNVLSFENLGGGVGFCCFFLPPLLEIFWCAWCVQLNFMRQNFTKLFFDIWRLFCIITSSQNFLQLALHDQEHQNRRFLKLQKSNPPPTPKKTNYDLKRSKTFSCWLQFFAVLIVFNLQWWFELRDSFFSHYTWFFFLK